MLANNRVDRQSGFNLLELLIVVAIIGIIAAIGYPSYVDYLNQARRADGHIKITGIMNAQEKYYSSNFTYSTDIVGDLGETTTSDEGYYSIAAAACSGSTISNCVNLTATAQGAQTSDTDCATITLSSRGEKGGTSGLNCW